MKKAKDYAAEFLASPTDETVGKIALAMLVEVKEIGEQRKIQRNEAIIPILNQQIDKWRSFVRQTGHEALRPDGLKLFIIKEFPFIPAQLLK